SLKQVHADADIFILPSGRESFGMAAAEAMAAGLPILGSTNVPVGRWAQAGHAGGMVSKNVHAFTRAAHALRALPGEELRVRGARACRCAESQFDRRSVAVKFLDSV